MPWRKISVLSVLCFTAIQILAEPYPLQHTNAPLSAAVTNPPLQKIDEGIFQIGGVLLNKNERTISFPATINMTNGPVEYLLVTSVGKLHESVLKSEVEPMHIQVAALLLGAKGAQTNLTVQQFDSKEIPGERIRLWISSKAGGNVKKIPAEDLVFNTQSNRPMSRGAWVYNGSQIHNGTFIAQRDGLLVSIISDPLALINNPRVGRQNDEIWFVNSNSVPPLNTPVQFTIQLEKK
jgi:hypothetical protein